MIKARAERKDGGGDILIFGIDDDNIRELRKGNAIKINLTEMGMKGEMLIFWGKDLDTLKKTMAPLVSPETTHFVHHDDEGG